MTPVARSYYGSSPRGSGSAGSMGRRLFGVVAAVAVVGTLFCAATRPAGAQAGAVVEDVSSQVRHVQVTLFKSKTLKIDSPFATVAVGQTDIADVRAMTNSTIYVQGKKVGTTNISVFDTKNQLVTVIDLEIVPDTGTLRNKIAASTGGSGISVSSAGGQVVLGGEASDAVSASRAVAVAKGLSPDAPIVDAMKVAASQQVMLKVRILEVDRTAGRALGVNWQLNGSKAQGSTGLGIYSAQEQFVTNVNGVPAVASTISVAQNPAASNSATGVGLSGVFTGASAGAAPFGSLMANIINSHGVNLNALISALEDKGLVKTLAEPDLIALSGVTAKFHAGQNIPVPTVQPGVSGGVPTVSVVYTPCGVDLAFVPTVLNNGLIDLQMHPSVCNISTVSSVQVDGTTLPTLTIREAETTVELRDGQSFAIAGLLQSTTTEDISQLPYLGSIPILGAMFRSTSFQKQETDLVVIVTPHLVKPASPGQHLETPLDTTLQANDVDLFLMGDLERKKKFTEYVTTGGDLKGPYGYILQAQ